MIKGFIKNKEDFTCENCGFFVKGNGYTNHCPQCFYSKHVDIAPGDRLATCGGMMKPFEISGSTNNIVISHVCDICGFERRNKLQSEDNIEELSKLVVKLNSQK